MRIPPRGVWSRLARVGAGRAADAPTLRHHRRWWRLLGLSAAAFLVVSALARQRGMCWRRLGLVRVAGRSMLPSLRPGDVLLVRWGAAVQQGDVVVAQLPNRPLVVKRAALREVRSGRGVEEGPGAVADEVSWWLESDNPAEGTDSWTLGAAVPERDVHARVLLRAWPWLRRGGPG